MTEQTTPEKKKSNNKAFYWCLAIGAIGALCLPDELKIVVIGTSFAVIGLIGIYSSIKSRKKLEPEIKAADQATKKWKREVDRTRHLANASLSQDRIAMNTTNPVVMREAESDSELFANAARATQVKLDPSPPKLNVLMDKLRKRKS